MSAALKLEVIEADAVATVEVVKRRWRVVRSKPSGERVAKQNLERQGFEVYLPMAYSEEPATPRRPKRRFVRAFLPRILFVRFDPTIDQWRSISSTVGVQEVFMVGDQPAAVPERDVQDIMDREEAGLIKLACRASVKATWKEGQAVRLIGRSADMDAIFQELLDENRAVIFVTLLGRRTRQVVTPLLLR